MAMTSNNGASKFVTIPDGRSLGAVNAGRPLTKVALSPDGSAFATAGEDGVVQVWSVKDSRELAKARQRSRALDLAFSANGELVVSVTANGDLQKLPVSSPNSLAQIQLGDRCDPAAFSADGTWLVCVKEGDASVIRVADTKLVRQFTWQSYEPDFNEPAAVSITSDGKIAAVVQEHGETIILNISGIGPLKSNLGRTPEAIEVTRLSLKTATSGTFSPKGRLFASSSKDGTVRLVEIPSGRELARINQGTGVNRLALSDSGWLATGDERSYVRLWSTGLDRMRDRLCTSPGENLSRDEWMRLGNLNSLVWRPICPSWTTPRQ